MITHRLLAGNHQFGAFKACPPKFLHSRKYLLRRKADKAAHAKYDVNRHFRVVHQSRSTGNTKNEGSKRLDQRTAHCQSIPKGANRAGDSAKGSAGGKKFPVFEVHIEAD